MPKIQKKSKAQKENKTEMLDQILQEWRRIEEKLNEIKKDITSLEAQYQANTISQQAFQKSTYQNLSKAYNERDTLNAQLQQIQIKYNAIEVELESSSSNESEISEDSESKDESPRLSRSITPTIIGWECNICLSFNFNHDPQGHMCDCGHYFCNHCKIKLD
jgi:hypothetical protein